jgi:N-methylhydantoinase A
VRLLHNVDMRYKGQIHEVSVPLVRSADSVDPDAIVRDFHVQYEKRYGRGTTNTAAPVEALSWEVRAAAPSITPALPERPASSTPPAEKSRREVYFRGGFQPTPVYDRESVSNGTSIQGAAIIEAPDTTILVNPGQSVTMDRYGNLVLDVH